MGAGRRTDQFEDRFNQGKPQWSGEKESYYEGAQLVAEFGDYRVFRGKDGYELMKKGVTVATFAEASLEQGRVVFGLSKGMLLELTNEGVREIFLKEKAGLHGLTASDGGMFRGRYEIKFVSKSPELVDLYSRYFKNVYGLEMHRDFYKHYPRARIYNKMAFFDLKNYGAKTGPYTWEVPRRYLDKEGAREWLKCFFSGDGELKKGNKGAYDIVFDSTHRSGLEQIWDLLLVEFGIESNLQPERDRTDEPDHTRPESVLRIKRKANVKFAREIGSYKRDHIKRLNQILEGEKKW